MVWKRLTGWLVVAACVVGLVLTFNMDTFALVDAMDPVAPAGGAESLPAGVIAPKRESVEIAARFAGMLRPFERYQLGFEVPGRILSLGTGPKGKLIDVGAYVQKGDVLARLDDALWRAARDEAKAHAERTQREFERAEGTRKRNPMALSESDFDSARTEALLAEARLRRAEKNLQDTVLLAPATGVVSQRMTTIGGNVAGNAPVFELLEVDRLLLVVGVPESRIGDLRPGQPVDVELVGRDLYNQARPALKGEVYRIGEAADDKTGLFEVEVLLPNPDRRLRPGLVARARIVVDHVEGVKLPLEALVSRGQEKGVFVVGADKKAHLVKLTQWTEQEDYLITPDPLPSEQSVVVRGQHRLVEGALVAATAMEPSKPEAAVLRSTADAKAARPSR